MFEGIALEGLAPIDGWTVAAILAKACGYAAALLTMGGVLFLAVFGRDDIALARFVRRIAIASAVVMLVVLALNFGIRSARISGMGVPGMTDMMMLGFVWESPLGSAAIWRCVGAALVLFLFWRNRIGLALAITGAVAIAISYAQIGHSLGEPRWALSLLLVLHLLAAAWWIGALAPLQRVTGSSNGADMLHRFGVIATGGVGVLIAVGVTFAWLLSGSVGALLGTAYGWTLLAKVFLVAALLGLAALNKLRLVPALASGQPGADQALRRSITLEMAAVAFVLLLTATLTSITTPPVNL